MILRILTMVLFITVLGSIAGVLSAPPFTSITFLVGVEAFVPIVPSHHHHIHYHYKSNLRHFPFIDPIGLTPNTAISVPTRATRTRTTTTTFTTTSLESAKVLPYLYNGLAAALVYKIRAVPGTVDKMVLGVLAVLSFSDFRTSDNVRLKSAKRACKKTMAISSETGKEEPSEEAQKWRSAVRTKILFQVLGMLRTVLSKESKGLFRGASFVLMGNALFLAGGGESRYYHDADGVCKPQNEDDDSSNSSTTSRKLVLSTLLCVGAFAASFVKSNLDAPPVLIAFSFGAFDRNLRRILQSSSDATKIA